MLQKIRAEFLHVLIKYVSLLDHLSGRITLFLAPFGYWYHFLPIFLMTGSCFFLSFQFFGSLEVVVRRCIGFFSSFILAWEMSPVNFGLINMFLGRLYGLCIRSFGSALPCYLSSLPSSLGSSGSKSYSAEKYSLANFLRSILSAINPLGTVVNLAAFAKNPLRIV